MNLTKHLKQAHDNVSFKADETWTSADDLYQKTNLQLHLREDYIQRSTRKQRPRTVRDCIPHSRLAHYANYPYSEAREMSYAPHYPTTHKPHPPTAHCELWELPEVEELYYWFMKHPSEEEVLIAEQKPTYESPLLHVEGFEDKVLKMELGRDRVKNLWKCQCSQEATPKIANLTVNVFTSPLRNSTIISTTKLNTNAGKRNRVSITHDFQHLQRLSKSIQDSSSAISSHLSKEVKPASEECASIEMLYSEVVQGLTANRNKASTSSKPDPIKEEQQENFTNFTVLNSQRTSSSDVRLSVDQTKSDPVPLLHMGAPRNPFQAPMVYSDRQKPVYFNQIFLPPPPVQRYVSLPANVNYSAQLLSSWFAQNSVNRIYEAASTLQKGREDDGGSGGFPSCSLEELSRLNNEEIGSYREVSSSISEELELQAQEQYSNSNDNFYKDLEREAAEQYPDSDGSN